MKTTNPIGKFLDTISEKLGYDRDSLFLLANLQVGGSTVSPNGGGGNPLKIHAKHEYTGREAYPFSGLHLFYDSLGQNYVDVQVVRKSGTGTVVIPEALYGWQHHVFPGNCRLCVNRWVRVMDSNNPKWDKDLLLAGLALRVAFAKEASTIGLCVTTGASSNQWSAELIDKFSLTIDLPGRKIAALNVEKFKV